MGFFGERGRGGEGEVFQLFDVVTLAGSQRRIAGWLLA